jgi:uncharacterized protein
MTQPRIRIPQNEINLFCRKNHIKRMMLFGSVISETFTPESDIDVLVEFDPDFIPGLGLIRMQAELSTIFGGRKIDLVTPKFLNRRIRDQIKPEVIYPYA